MGDYEYLEFELDAKDATVGLNGESSKNWPKFQLGRRLQNIVGIKILEAQIPFTYYTFESGFNTITLEGVYATYTITIPEGNYSLTQFTPVLQGLLNAINPSEFTWTVASGAYTKKFTITNTYLTPTPSLPLGNFKLYSSNPQLQQLLGLSTGATTNFSTQVGLTFTFTAPNAFNLSGPNYLYCNSTAVGTQCDVYLPQGPVFNGNVSPTLAKIPVTVNSGGLIRWQDPSPQSYFDLENLYNISEIDFYFTYPNSERLVKFNGESFSIKVGLVVKTDVHTVNTSSQFMTKRVVKRIKRK